jgi:hypothetical protein
VELYCHAAASPVGLTPDAKYELLENLAQVLNTVDTTEYSAESSDAAAPPSQVGVPFNQQLAKHRQRMGG